MERLAEASLSAALRHAQELGGGAAEGNGLEADAAGPEWRGAGPAGAWGDALEGIVMDALEADAAADPSEAGAGRASTTTLPEIERVVRWSAPVSVSDLINRRPSAPADFATPLKNLKGVFRVYRIQHGGRDLYVGLIRGPNQSVAGRIAQHVDNPNVKAASLAKSESKQLAKFLQDRRTSTFVRFADIRAPGGYRNDPKYAHAVELLLQSALRPRIYVPTSLSFEWDR